MRKRKIDLSDTACIMTEVIPTQVCTTLCRNNMTSHMTWAMETIVSPNYFWGVRDSVMDALERAIKTDGQNS